MHRLGDDEFGKAGRMLFEDPIHFPREPCRRIVVGDTEYQRCQRQSERHTHDRQPGADPDRVDQGDQKGGPHISDQRVKAGPSRVADPLARCTGRSSDVAPQVTV